MKDLKYVTKKKTGKRYVYRRVNGGLVPLPLLPENSDEFLAAYAEAGLANPNKTKARKDSLQELCVSYLRSSGYLRLAESSRRARRGIAMSISGKYDVIASAIQSQHIQTDIDKTSPGARRNRRKTWRALMQHAVDQNLRKDNPTTNTKANAPAYRGASTWTEDEITRHLNTHGPGTRARLTMLLLLCAPFNAPATLFASAINTFNPISCEFAKRRADQKS